MTKINLNELFRTLHRLNRQMHRTYHREGHGGKGGVYHGQANLLLLILQNDGASQRDLSELLDIRPSSLTEMLTKLEQSNLVERKQDEKDQRVMHIHLTGEGKAMAEKIADSKDEFAESFFSALTEEEQEQLFILTEKLCKSLEAAENGYQEGCHGHFGGYRGEHRHEHGHHGEYYHGHRHHGEYNYGYGHHPNASWKD